MKKSNKHPKSKKSRKGRWESRKPPYITMVEQKRRKEQSDIDRGIVDDLNVELLSVNKLNTKKTRKVRHFPVYDVEDDFGLTILKPKVTIWGAFIIWLRNLLSLKRN